MKYLIRYVPPINDIDKITNILILDGFKDATHIGDYLFMCNEIGVSPDVFIITPNGFYTDAAELQSDVDCRYYELSGFVDITSNDEYIALMDDDYGLYAYRASVLARALFLIFNKKKEREYNNEIKKSY